MHVGPDINGEAKVKPIGTIWRESVQEFEKEILPVLKLWPLFVIAGMACGISFAFRDYDRVNPLISFPVGILTGVLYFIFSYGSLISLTFFTSFFFSVSKDRYQKRLTYASYSHDTVHWRFWIYGILATALWAAPLFAIVNATPVLGEQVSFMFRDRD